MARYAMLIDTRRCVGCYACRIACQMRNGLQDAEGFVRFEHYEGGTYPNPTSSIVPVQCMHCADAPCEKVCPTGATYITDSGVVLVDEEKCIDCKYCVAACPYDVRTPIQGAAPYVDKCRFCFDGAKGAPDSPSCANTCITRCRTFGDVDDPESDISKALVELDPSTVIGDPGKTGILYVGYPGSTGDKTADGLVDALGVMKPLTAAAAVAVVAGLGVSLASGAGFKHEKMRYDEKAHDIISADTGQVVRHIDKEAGER